MNHPLAGHDAVILDFLVQVVAIGRRRGVWGTADVRRVCAEYLRPGYRAHRPPPTTPAVRQTKPRPPVAHPPVPAGQRKPVELTPRQAAVLAALRSGRDHDQIAAELHVARATAHNAVTLVVRALGAVDRHHAVELVEAEAVDIRIRSRKRAA